MIDDVRLVPVLGGFFHDDQAALRVGAPNPRVASRGLGIGLRLTSGELVWGDAVSVQYAGAAGRDPLLDPEAAAAALEADWVPRIRGLAVDGWIEATDAAIAALGEHDHTALRYGVSQATLAAAAAVRGTTMAEVVADALDVPLDPRPVPIFAQSGEHRREAVERMLLKRVEVLPHGLFSTPAGFEELLDFAAWLAAEARAIDGYDPVLHFDVYGQVGLAHGNDIDAIAGYLQELAHACRPFTVRVESPADFGSRQAQIEGGAALRRALEGRVQIVADEWCNTLADVEAFARAQACDMAQIKTPDVGSLVDSARAVLACREHGIGAYLGGSCTETETSARACVHVAVATQPDMQLAKPGMGVDEGLMLATNEQARLLASLGARRSC